MRHFDVFSLGVSLPALYVVLFFIVPLLSLAGIPGYPAEFSLETELLVGAALAGFLVGYHLLPARTFRRVAGFLAVSWDERRAWFTVGTLVALGLAGKAFRVLSGGYFHTGRDPSFSASSFASVAGYLDWAGYLALGAALIMYFSLRAEGKRAWMPWGIVAGGLFALEFFYGFFSCARIAVIMPVLIYLLTRWYIAGIAWWKIVLTLVFAAALVFPFGNACRNPAKLGNAAATNVPGMANRLPALAAESFVSRMDFSRLLTQVRARDLHAFKSDLLSDFFVSFGPPRFLWAGKPPSMNARGNQFGRESGILSPDDRATAVSPLFVGELIINFGVPGMVASMALLGMFAKALYAALIGEKASPTGILAYTVVWVELMKGTEGWIAPLFAGLVKLLILVLVIHLVVRSRPETAVAATP